MVSGAVKDKRQDQEMKSTKDRLGPAHNTVNSAIKDRHSVIWWLKSINSTARCFDLRQTPRRSRLCA